MKIPTYEEISMINEGAYNLRQQIDDKIKKKSDISQIIQLFSNERIQEIAVKNQSIYILYIVSRIVETEIREGVGRNLFDDRTTDEVIKVYKRLTLYLRRIEFSFPQELQREIIDYVLREKISVVAILAVINKNESIIQKEKVIKGLNDIFRREMS